MARDVTETGSLLSWRLYAVCIVNFVWNINCLCHLNPFFQDMAGFFSRLLANKRGNQPITLALRICCCCCCWMALSLTSDSLIISNFPLRLESLRLVCNGSVGCCCSSGFSSFGWFGTGEVAAKRKIHSINCQNKMKLFVYCCRVLRAVLRCCPHNWANCR